MTAPRIAVISNPHSGWNKTHLQKLDAVLQDYPHVPHYVTADHDALYDALSACREQRVDMIVINGGDGTIDDCLTLLRGGDLFDAGAEPSFAFLPGGTTNMTHMMRGSGRSVLRGLKQILKRASQASSWSDFAPYCKARPVLKVQVKGTDKPIYGFFFGTAGIPKAISYSRSTYHEKGLRGAIGHVLTIGKMIIKLLRGHIYEDPVLHPVEVQYGFEDYKWRDSDAVLFYVTALPRLLLGIKTHATRQQYCIGGLGVPYYRLLSSLVPFWRGKTPQDGSSAFFSFATDQKVALKFSASWTLDGALYDFDGQTELEIEQGTPLQVYEFE